LCVSAPSVAVSTSTTVSRKAVPAWPQSEERERAMRRRGRRGEKREGISIDR